MGQLQNTVHDLLSVRAPDVAESVLEEVADALDGLPKDRREPLPQDIHGSYRRLDQSMQQLHVDAIYALGVKLGKALTTTDRLGEVVGGCATDEDADNDDACLDDFVTAFGERALRAPDHGRGPHLLPRPSTARTPSRTRRRTPTSSA